MRIGLPPLLRKAERDRAAYWPTSRTKIGGLIWYSILTRGIVSDENREPSSALSMVRRENCSELRMAVVGRTSSDASMRELFPGAASRNIGTSPRVIAPRPVK